MAVIAPHRQVSARGRRSSGPLQRGRSRLSLFFPREAMALRTQFPLIRPPPTVLGRSGRTRQILAICNGFDVE